MAVWPSFRYFGNFNGCEYIFNKVYLECLLERALNLLRRINNPLSEFQLNLLIIVCIVYTISQCRARAANEK